MGDRGYADRGRTQHRGRGDKNRGSAYGHAKKNNKKTKKRPKKKGVSKYFNSKFRLDEAEEKELDRGVHGDYVTGQIGAATRKKAWKAKSRLMKANEGLGEP